MHVCAWLKKNAELNRTINIDWDNVNVLNSKQNNNFFYWHNSNIVRKSSVPGRFHLATLIAFAIFAAETCDVDPLQSDLPQVSLFLSLSPYTVNPEILTILISLI